MGKDKEILARFSKVFDKGQVIFRECEAGDVMYLIQTGQIKIHKTFIDEDTGDQIDKELAILGKGDFFGEMSLLNSEERSATATAIEDSNVLEINNSIFEQIVLSNGKFAYMMISKLAERVRNTSNLIREGLFQYKQQAFLSGILSVITEDVHKIDAETLFKKLNKEGIDIDLKINRTEFKNLLSNLVEAGLISASKDGIRVLDGLRIRQTLNLLKSQ